MSEALQTNNKTDAKSIKYPYHIIKDPLQYNFIDNAFSICTLKNGNIYLVYSTRNNSIISFDLLNFHKLNEIKQAHKGEITNIRYYYDIININDLILSTSSIDSTIKIWSLKNFKCILNLENIYEGGNIYSACFITDNGKNYIASSNYEMDNLYPIRIYDFDKKIVKEIDDSKDMIFKIDSLYDKKSSKNYIITCSYGFEKSYNFQENKLYRKYHDNDDCAHFDFLIHEYDDKIQLIESSELGTIRFWNFHSGNLMKKVTLDECFHMIYLWNNDYLFAGILNVVKLIDLKKGTIDKTLDDNQKDVNNVKGFIHPKYGKCLLSQNYEGIILWTKENNLQLNLK